MEQKSKKDGDEKGTDGKTASIDDGPKDYGYSVPGDGSDKAAPDKPRSIDDGPKDYGYSITSE